MMEIWKRGKVGFRNNCLAFHSSPSAVDSKMYTKITPLRPNKCYEISYYSLHTQKSFFSKYNKRIVVAFVGGDNRPFFLPRPQTHKKRI